MRRRIVVKDVITRNPIVKEKQCMNNRTTSKAIVYRQRILQNDLSRMKDKTYLQIPFTMLTDRLEEDMYS